MRIFNGIISKFHGDCDNITNKTHFIKKSRLLLSLFSIEHLLTVVILTKYSTIENKKVKQQKIVSIK